MVRVTLARHDSCKRRQTPLVNPRLNVAVSDAFQVDHRRRDVPMPHPLLECADIDAVLEIPGREGVPEFMEKPAGAVGPFGTAVDPDGSILQFV